MPNAGALSAGVQLPPTHAWSSGADQLPLLKHVIDDIPLSVNPGEHENDTTVPDTLAAVEIAPFAGALTAGHITGVTHAGGPSSPGAHVTQFAASPEHVAHAGAQLAHDHDRSLHACDDWHVRDAGPTRKYPSLHDALPHTSSTLRSHGAPDSAPLTGADSAGHHGSTLDTHSSPIVYPPTHVLQLVGCPASHVAQLPEHCVQIGIEPDQLPSLWHVRLVEPTSVNPPLHENAALPPTVRTSESSVPSTGATWLGQKSGIASHDWSFVPVHAWLTEHVRDAVPLSE